MNEDELLQGIAEGRYSPQMLGQMGYAQAGAQAPSSLSFPQVYNQLATAAGYPPDMAQAAQVLPEPQMPGGGDLLPPEAAQAPTPPPEPSIGSQVGDAAMTVLGFPFRALGAFDTSLRRMTGQLPNLYDSAQAYRSATGAVIGADARLSPMLQRSLVDGAWPKSTVAGRVPTGGSFGDLADTWKYAVTGRGVSPMDQLRFSQSAYKAVVGRGGLAKALESIAAAQRTRVSGLQDIAATTEKIVRLPGEVAKTAADAAEKKAKTKEINELLPYRKDNFQARTDKANAPPQLKPSDIRAEQDRVVKEELAKLEIIKANRKTVDALKASGDLDPAQAKALGLKEGVHFKAAKTPGWFGTDLGSGEGVEFLPGYTNPSEEAYKNARSARPDLFTDTLQQPVDKALGLPSNATTGATGTTGTAQLGAPVGDPLGDLSVEPIAPLSARAAKIKANIDYVGDVPGNLNDDEYVRRWIGNHARASGYDPNGDAAKEIFDKLIPSYRKKYMPGEAR